MRRLEMPRAREVLRLKYEVQLSLREIAQACNCGKSTVAEILGWAEKARIAWPIDFNDKQLMSLLYPATEKKASFPEPDMEYNAIEYEECDISEEERNSKKPGDIQKCIKAGVLPACYEGTAIGIEVQGLSQLSCFLRNENGTVTCPMENLLSKVKQRGKCIIYANKNACRQCTNRKGFKTVSFGPETKYVPVRMYGKAQYELNKIPEGIPLNPFNHTLVRKDYIKPKKVMLKIQSHPHMFKERNCLSEHPFGTVKWYHGAHYLLCKGKEKATAELGLSFLAYNLKRAISLIGTRKLIEAMKR